MLRRALLIAVVALPLTFAAGCKGKKTAEPSVPPAAATPVAPPTAPAPPPATTGGGVDRRIEGAAKALGEAAGKRDKQLGDVGKAK